jgi:hypothetical protein
VERALAAELRGTPLEAGARAHLRFAARACDLAEALEDVDGSAKMARAYLDVRQAYGLAGISREPLDPFAAFVAGLSVPTVGNTPDP